MTTLPDSSARRAFTEELGTHFSVIAPAGVGKTRTLVDRILAICRRHDSAQVLPRMAVVTFSVRTAREMQIRARVAVQEAGLAASVQRAFDQVFFGTIHSYCLRLIQRFGDRLGLPARARVPSRREQDELWEAFLNSKEFRALGDELQFAQQLFRVIEVDAVYRFAKGLPPGPVPEPVSPPSLNFTRIKDYLSPNPRARPAIKRKQDELRSWELALREKTGWTPLPDAPRSADRDFCERWQSAFQPLHLFLEQSLLRYGRLVANAFAEYRFQRGFLNYDDQVQQACRLLDVPDVQEELGHEPPIILLDEAQDTDAQQFEVLLRAAGWRRDGGPVPGQTICVVGDFQQLIYNARANSQDYRRVHEELINSLNGAEAIFQVTFRCDLAIVDFVNSVFPVILDGAEEQAAFVPLVPRPGVDSGLVQRWSCPELPRQSGSDSEPPTVEMTVEQEAQELAAQFKRMGFSGLNADSWKQVAILCPRVAWLKELEVAFVQAGIPVQVHSTAETRADRAAYRWFTALFWILAHPGDSFEVSGVLRDIFGISDHDLALFTGGDGDFLRLDLFVSKSSKRRHGEASSSGELIHDILQHLSDLSIKCQRIPLHRAADELIRETRLRERLTAVEDDNADRDLDDLMALIFERSAQGSTWSEMAQELRDSMHSPDEVDDEIQNAVQLLTSFKAKGLEWQAVVIPFMFRPIGFKFGAFPRIVSQLGGQPLVQLQASSEPDNLIETPVNRAERQNYERLMYVACTRAKRALVLVDDEALFALVKAKQKPGGRGRLSSSSLLRIEIDGMNRENWDALPLLSDFLEPQLRPARQLPAAWQSQGELSFDDKPDAPQDRLRSLTIQEVNTAVHAARNIPKRITPHALAGTAGLDSIDFEPAAIHEEPEPTEPRATGPSDETAVAYGLWWHETAQFTPWGADPGQIAGHWARGLARCPQPDRGDLEWRQLQASALFPWLCTPGRLLRAECPFLWPQQDRLWVEGIIDLIGFEPEDQVWRVVDWKTNRSGDLQALGDSYRPQVDAYCRALHSLFKAPVIGSIYITGLGEWSELIRVE